MPRNKVLERAKVTMPSGRSAFDLSQIRSFDALAGELNVCYCQPMVAGTKGKISRKTFTRTAQVVSPAFHSVTEHFDFFVVPIHSLWRSWENWKLNINDLQDTLTVPWDSSSNLPDLSLPANTPRMDYNGLLHRVFNPTQSFTLALDAAKCARKCCDALKLCDSLGYDEFNTHAYGSNNRVMNLFFLAAYQKCYFDHYRNTAYEANNPYAYNLDWLSNDSVRIGILNPDADSGGTNVKDIAVAEQLLQIRRVNYRNDYFHNIYPNLNYVSSAITGSSSFSIPSDIGQLLAAGSSATVFDSGTVLTLGVQNGSSGVSVSRGGVAVGKSDVTSYTVGVSVQSIRAAFALDKLMRASAYAPKHVRDQYKALYGVDGVEDFDMKSERIGSFQSDVVFQEVTNMAESSSYELGSLGAKGIGSGDKDGNLNFYCKYDSIVIGLHYFMPRARYDSYGLHPFNIKISKEQFFIRAFEHLGLRPFYRYYVDGEQSAVVLGWTEANFEYKILPDLNTGLFKRKYIQCNSHNPSAGVYVVALSQQTSELSTYVPHNEQPLNSATVTAEYFKIAPEDLNNIFKVAVTVDHNRAVTQFFGEFRISVPVVAPMSTHSQPML